MDKHVDSYAAIIDAFSNGLSLEVTEKFFYEMIELGLEPDDSTIACLLTCYYQKRNLEKAEMLITDHNSRLGLKSYSTYLKFLASMRHFEKLEKLYNQLRLSDRFKLDYQFYADVLVSLGMKSPKLTLLLYEKMHQDRVHRDYRIVEKLTALIMHHKNYEGEQREAVKKIAMLARKDVAMTRAFRKPWLLHAVKELGITMDNSNV